MKMDYHFIRFIKDRGENWICTNSRSGDPLGSVEEYADWDQFVFVPRESVIFSADCLVDIAHFLRQLSKK